MCGFGGGEPGSNLRGVWRMASVPRKIGGLAVQNGRAVLMRLMVSFFVSVVVALLLFLALAHCILREERRHVNYDKLAGDMRIEARYRATVWLRGGCDDER